MRICFFIASLAFILASCNSKTKKTSLEKVWFYDDDLTQEEEVENVQKYGGPTEYYYSSASFINLQPDGNFTSYLSAFDYGKWKLQDSILVLTNHNNGKLSLEVKHLDDDALICFNRRDHKVYRFLGFKNDFASDTTSPFSIANNMWRAKASHKESDLELAARLKNHFKFWEKYFAWGAAIKKEQLDVVNTPSVLDIYANGFKLQYYDSQSPEWQRVFFDSSNCWRAYEMVHYLMYKNEIEWPKTESSYERLTSAFKQLQHWMDADPKTYLPVKGSPVPNVEK